MMKQYSILFLCCLFLKTALGSVGYSVSLFYSKAPTVNCSAHFSKIRDAIYKDYVDEMVTKTDVTFQEVNSIDPDWYVRRLQSQNLRGEIQKVSDEQKIHRRLPACSQTICAKGPYEIALRGCTNCGRRELALTSTSTKTTIALPDPTRPYGNKTSRIYDTKGSSIVEEFYQTIDNYFSVTDPCRDQFNSLIYQFNDLFFY